MAAASTPHDATDPFNSHWMTQTCMFGERSPQRVAKMPTFPRNNKTDAWFSQVTLQGPCDIQSIDILDGLDGSPCDRFDFRLTGSVGARHAST